MLAAELARLVERDSVVGAGNHRRAGRDRQCAAPAVFEPIARMDAAEGPMKTMPASSQAAAKSAFSLRKP